MNGYDSANSSHNSAIEGLYSILDLETAAAEEGWTNAINDAIESYEVEEASTWNEYLSAEILAWSQYQVSISEIPTAQQSEIDEAVALLNADIAASLSQFTATESSAWDSYFNSLPGGATADARTPNAPNLGGVPGGLFQSFTCPGPRLTDLHRVSYTTSPAPGSPPDVRNFVPTLVDVLRNLNLDEFRLRQQFAKAKLEYLDDIQRLRDMIAALESISVQLNVAYNALEFEKGKLQPDRDLILCYAETVKALSSELVKLHGETTALRAKIERDALTLADGVQKLGLTLSAVYAVDLQSQDLIVKDLFDYLLPQTS